MEEADVRGIGEIVGILSRVRLSNRGLLIVIGALITMWLGFAGLALSNMSNVFSDFAVFYSASAVLSDHSGSIYDISTIIAAAHRHHACALYPHPAYLYPPLLAIVLQPLVALPCGAAVQVWLTVQLVSWAASAVLVTLWLHRSWRPKLVVTGVALAFTLLCWPLASGLIQFAQVDSLILVGLLLAPWLIVHGHPKSGGAVLACIAMIKVIPILLIGYYLLRGRWRVTVGALVYGAVLLIFQAVVVGLPELIAMRSILSNSSVFVAQADNFSLLHLPVWLALTVGIRIPLSSSLPGDILVGTVAMVFLASTLATHSRHFAPTASLSVDTNAVDAEQVDLLGYAWAVCVMILLTPLVWLHYLAWLLVPLSLGGGYLLRHWRGRGHLAALAFLVGGCVLATLRLPLSYDTRPEYVLDPYLGTYALRPLLMTLHPLGELLVAATIGVIFSRVAGIVPRQVRYLVRSLKALSIKAPSGVALGSRR